MTKKKERRWVVKVGDYGYLHRTCADWGPKYVARKDLPGATVFVMEAEALTVGRLWGSDAVLVPVDYYPAYWKEAE